MPSRTKRPLTPQMSRYWQDRADEARAVADSMNDAHAQATLRGIAHRYDALATRAAEREAASSNLSHSF